MPSMQRTLILSTLCCAALLAGCGADQTSESATAATDAQAVSAGPHAQHQAGIAGEISPGHDSAQPTASDGHHHVHLNIPESGVGTVLTVGDGHGHLMREAPDQAQPSVRLRAKADPAGGWTLQVITSGFGWTPEQVNTSADAGTGHAHLYVGGRKVARIYGEWVFLPATQAQPGDTLSVILYADDHSAWAVGGKPVQADVVLPGLPA